MLGIVGFVATVGAYGVLQHRACRTPRRVRQPRVRRADDRLRPDRQDRAGPASARPSARSSTSSTSSRRSSSTPRRPVEDKTFWSNAGFDPVGDHLRRARHRSAATARGASTITQQLVRARLLPESAFPARTYERKIREIIQSIRLTQEFPAWTASSQIIIDYLNQNFYGNQSYGVAAAAQDYFGVTDLHKLTLAQVAILAAIPQSPTAVRPAQERRAPEVGHGCDAVPGRPKLAAKCVLAVPLDSKVAQRRNRS